MAIAINDALSIRESVLDNRCPFCGKRGWVSIMGHIAKKHQITRDRFNDMALITKEEQLCSDDYFEACRQRLNNRIALGLFTPDQGGRKGRHRQLTIAAQQQAREMIMRIRPTGPLNEETRNKISLANRGKIPWNKKLKLERIHDIRSRQAKEFWEKFKTLPLIEQQQFLKARVASRRRRDGKNMG